MGTPQLPKILVKGEKVFWKYIFQRKTNPDSILDAFERQCHGTRDVPENRKAPNINQSYNFTNNQPGSVTTQDNATKISLI